MKFFSFIVLSLVLSCNSTKTKEKTVSGTENTASKEIAMECPEEGTCDFSVMKNKALVVKTDGIGMNYPQFEKSSETSVVKFTYHREAKNGMTDGDYTEEVYFEVANDAKSIMLADKSLQQVQLLYGRLCYCKGSAGYFKVTDGTLKFERNKDGSASFSLVFANNQVPQIIKKVAGTVAFE